MPWFGWIAIVAIVVFGALQLVSMFSGRPIPWQSRGEDTQALEDRIAELEKKLDSGEIEAPRAPTRSEENLAAEDRWRLDMLETRLENLEARPGASQPDQQPRPENMP